MLARVPIVLSQLVDEPERLWRLSSAAMVVVWLAISIVLFRPAAPDDAAG